jgi:methanogenic corrinoid protein MtbC1
MVAALDDPSAEALLEEDRRSLRGSGDRGPVAEGDEGAGSVGTAGMVEAAYRMTLQLDADGLEAALRRFAVTLGAYPFLEDVVGPLLHRVGTAWSHGDLGPAQEHLCTAVVERVLGWLSQSAAAEPGRPRMVVATLSGERHGLGARLVAAASALEGWHVTHLGVDLPAGEIAAAAARLGARVVALSVVNPDTLPGIPTALAELAGAVSLGTTVVLGGAAAGRLGPHALPVGSEVVLGLSDLRVVLRGLA